MKYRMCMAFSLTLVLPFTLCVRVGASDVAPVSPRIEHLREDLRTGKQGAVQAFWKRVAKNGTPLVESIPGDDRHLLVTFLWRGKPGSKQVIVFANIDSDIPKIQMTRLGNTDVWSKTYLLPKGTRLTYAMSESSQVNPNDNLGKHLSTLRPDPLNHKHFVFLPHDQAPNPHMYTFSLLEAPGAAPDWWDERQPGVPAGQVEERHIKSKILQEDRRIWVYTPAQYTGHSTGYPLLVVFDGFDYLHEIPTPTILDNLAARHLFPPAVAVFVDDPPRSRTQDLFCSSSFTEFLATELVPWLRENYRVTHDPSQTIVCGSSLGGLMAAFCALRHPEVFGRVVSQSGSYWWSPPGDLQPEWLTRQFVASPRLPIFFHLDVGLFEDGPSPGGPPNLLVNRRLRDALFSKGYAVDYYEVPGAHEWVSWEEILPEGLMAVVRKAPPNAK